MEWSRDEMLISTDKHKINLHYVHRYLSEDSYWAKGIPLEIVRKSIEGSVCFGVYHQKSQIGFARMITDCATFAYLADVFIDENYRGRGIASWLMESILAYPEFQGLRRILLATKDAHSLYAQFGFSVIPNPERMMHILDPLIYTRK